MKLLTSLLTLSFLPSFHGLGLLLLRVWIGGCMFYIHGLEKLKDFGGMSANFQKMGFHPVLAYGAILAESVAAVLLAIGLATRWSAAVLGTTMAVAFYKGHGAILKSADHSVPTGELAFIYLGACAAILLTGPGRFSLDAQISKRPATE